MKLDPHYISPQKCFVVYLFHNKSCCLSPQHSHQMADQSNFHQHTFCGQKILGWNFLLDQKTFPYQNILSDRDMLSYQDGSSDQNSLLDQDKLLDQNSLPD